MTAAFRCAADSEELSEPLAGTGSTVRSFLLVEAPGPWGVDAVRDSRLPGEVKQRLGELESRHRIRPLLIRRHGRPDGGGEGASSGTRVFAAHVHPDRPWTETIELGEVEELLDLDLSGLGIGRSPGLASHDEPLFLVCTHGRHDACCAERGRPLAAAMSLAAPGETWEVSHIGGDRFAANVLVLPYGLYYGRLVPGDAERFARAHRAGELDLAHLRGRSAYPFAVQAAEVYLRRRIAVNGIQPLSLERLVREGTQSRAVFAVEGRRWEVLVDTEAGSPRQLTCRATSTSCGSTHRLLDIRPA